MKRWRLLPALALCAAFVFGLSSCSNGSDGAPMVVTTPSETQSGGTQTAGGEQTGTSSGGGSETPITPTSTPAPAATYAIIFNANDGSENPATVSQNFTEGTPQALKSISELGFSKDGCFFAGWGTAADATESVYADGAEYTASADITFYAIWSVIPVYSVSISPNEHGAVNATPATGIAGTRIMLSNTPAAGYRFDSYSVTAADSTSVTVTDGKFTMPAQDVTITASYIAIDYNITINSMASGSVIAAIDSATTSVTTANCGQTVILTATPASDYYRLSAMTVTAADGTNVTLKGSGNTRTFTMLAQNVTISATFESKTTITITDSFEGGTIVASIADSTPVTAAFTGEIVTLTAKPQSDYYRLNSMSVTAADGTNITLEGTDNKRTFAMPSQNVLISATFESKYTITIPDSFEGGTVVASIADSASVKAAFAGEMVRLTTMPVPGYELVTLIVTTSDGTSVIINGTDDKRNFEMPAKNVTVTAKFNALINVENAENGSVTVNKTSAAPGTLVTLTITPASEYKLETLVVKDADNSSIVVNKHYYDSIEKQTFYMPEKSVTVTATFSLLPSAASGAYTETETDIVTFGLWPQTVKSGLVDIYNSKTKKVGDFTYKRGSDGQWYVKMQENAYYKYKYSNGASAYNWSAYQFKWFKVEPIKWRILTTEYNETGKKLLLAENVLVARYYDSSKNDYQNSEMRKWLNSNSRSDAVSDYGSSDGFLKTAFTVDELASIVDTSVDNSTDSTLPDNFYTLTDTVKNDEWNGGRNRYSSYKPTTDKIFLLSEQEATKSEYGFDVYNASDVGNARIRQTTDYALAGGVRLGEADDKGGWWWLRSPSTLPDPDENSYQRVVNGQGKAYSFSSVSRRDDNYAVGIYSLGIGVVPALCVEN